MNMVIGTTSSVSCMFYFIFQTNYWYTIKNDNFKCLELQQRFSERGLLILYVNQLWFSQRWCGANHGTNRFCDSCQKWDPVDNISTVVLHMTLKSCSVGPFRLIWPCHYCSVPEVKLWRPKIGGSYPFICWIFAECIENTYHTIDVLWSTYWFKYKNRMPCTDITVASSIKSQI